MKKPGEFKKQQKRHKTAQTLRDLLKRLHEGETVWITLPETKSELKETFRGEKVTTYKHIKTRYRISPVPMDLDVPATVLARIPKKRGYRLAVGELHSKKQGSDWRVFTCWGAYHVHDPHILGVVTEGLKQGSAGFRVETNHE